MKNLLPKIATLSLFILTVSIFSNLHAQTIALPANFYGTNYWYYSTSGGVDINRFSPKVSDLRNAKIKMVRIGGNYLNTTKTNIADFPFYDHAIDSVVGMGGTPIVQIPINLDSVNYNTWISHFNSKGINYYAIGNEPDPSPNWLDWYNDVTTQDGNTYTQFKAKFIAIATAIKNASNTDTVVGPDFRLFFDAGASNPLNTYYQNFISTVGIATANGGIPILDIFTFHYYGFITDGMLATRFATLKSYISSVNANAVRSGKKLSIAMGEVNAFADSSSTVKPWDFSAGQFLGICAKYVMKNSGEFICPWSVYESSGNHSNSDYSLYNSDSTRRSTMWHLSLLSANWRGYYMASVLSKVNFFDRIIAFGMTDLLGSTVMIMNTTTTPYTYSAKLNNSYSAAVVNVKIKFATKNANTTEWNETIPAKTTIVYTVSDSGTLLNKYVYDSLMTNGPSLTVLAVANVRSGALTNILEANDEVHLYPVPVWNNLNVDGAVKCKSIQIYNNAGQVVYTMSNPNQSSIKIDVSRLTPGMYFMYLKTDSKTVVKKIIKN